MKQIIQSYKTGEVMLEEVPAPLCKAGGVLVRNVCSILSPGTERLMIETGKKNLLGKAKARPDLVRLAWEKAKKEGFINVFKEAMNRLDEPVPLGYSSSGVVVEVGKGVREFKVGDKVACCGAGFASHAEYVWVPKNLCTHIPEGVSFEEASFVMPGAIALHGIRCAEINFGENVAVIGLGFIGLITAQILSSYGCKTVCLDIDKRKCEVMKKVSKDILVENDEIAFERLVEQETQGNGVDAVIITAASKDNRPLLLSEKICRKSGTIVLLGMADISLTRKTMWEKEIRFLVSRAAGPGSIEEIYEKKGYDYPIEYIRWTEKRNMEEFLELVRRKKINLEGLITHTFNIENALDAYKTILEGKEFYTGILLKYNEEPSFESKVFLKPFSAKIPSSKSIGVIGGGLFTKNILLPHLKKINGINLIGIATTSGYTSVHVGKKFGFKYATSDYKKILEDNNINNVIITTPHNLHASMVVESLEAGKNVFVEKPLCINKEELKNIVETYNSLEKKPKIMVGFNRPFSPLSKEMKKFLKKRTTPLLIHYRINAGFIPKEHWTQDLNVGGGRIIGEVCHFVNFLQFITDSIPQRVYAESIEGKTGKYLKDDNIIANLKFKDGSLGTILYSAKGSKAFSRERVEVFCEDSVSIIEDFKKLLIVEGSRKKKINKFSQDMGYLGELRFFLENERFESEIFKNYIYTMLATFSIVESLEKAMPIVIKEDF